MPAVSLRNLAQVAADNFQFSRRGHVVVVVPGVEHRCESVPLALFAAIESEATDKRHEFAQHRGFGVDVRQ